MTDFEQFALRFIFFWAILCSLVFAYYLDDIHQRVKQLQATLEEFIDDVQE